MFLNTIFMKTFQKYFSDQSVKNGYLYKNYSHYFKRSTTKGFTLAETLIVLSLLGLISGFTITKLINSEQKNKNNAIAKEAASMVASAYLLYQQDGHIPNANTKFEDLLPYLSYVKIDTTSTVDSWPNPFAVETQQCSDYPCVVLHNGGIIMISPNVPFQGNASNYSIAFNVDPDGKVNGNKAVVFLLYFNGRISTIGKAASTDYINGGNGLPTPNASYDPAWLIF